MEKVNKRDDKMFLNYMKALKLWAMNRTSRYESLFPVLSLCFAEINFSFHKARILVILTLMLARCWCEQDEEGKTENVKRRVFQMRVNYIISIRKAVVDSQWTQTAFRDGTRAQKERDNLQN